LQFIYGVRRDGLLDYIGQLWRRYGDIFQVRLGPRTMLFAMHPDAIDQVTGSGRHRYDKRVSFDPVRRFLTGEGLVGSTGDLWRRQRKLMSPFFTPKGIRVYADVMIHDAVRMQERWQALAQAGGEVQIAEEMSRVTASIILKSMFSVDTIDAIDQMRSAIETMIAFVAHA
jgi:cytochrome P450